MPNINLRYLLVAFHNGKKVAITDITDKSPTEIERIVMDWERKKWTWGYEHEFLNSSPSILSEV